MEALKNHLFYSRLPANTIPLTDLMGEHHLFYTIPQNWHIVVTDIRNSTKAALDGLHQTVNLVATGSIVAALNVAYKNDITIPFFFGGDGATFIIPPVLLHPVMQALNQHRKNTMVNFNLDLRVGQLPVDEVYAQKHELSISKFKVSALFDIPILIGDGLIYAEKIIKGPKDTGEVNTSPDYELDMTGMQCRWDKIKPPDSNFEVISLLVVAREGVQQSSAFTSVLQAIDESFGSRANRTPISTQKLKLRSTLGKISAEMKARLGHFNAFYLIKNIAATILGKLYFKTRKGKEYLHTLVETSDVLVIDGRINTVITGTALQREMLDNALSALENQGLILYGMHISSESVMSCYVRNINNHHIHFVDGSDGGYTKASEVLKKKIRFQAGN